MRTCQTLSIVVVIVSSGLAVFGCQYIAGVAGLKANGSAGGAGGAGGQGGSGGAGGTDTPCATSADCNADEVCFSPMMMVGKCSACGASPLGPQSPPPCSTAGCDVCEGETCITHCQAPNDCVGNQTLEAMVRPARIVCIGQCNDITVTCSGGNPCEVFCDSGGCQNLKLQCGPEGACKLTCKPGACVGASIVCGENSCTAKCDVAMPITQTCNGSCSCEKLACE